MSRKFALPVFALISIAISFNPTLIHGASISPQAGLFDGEQLFLTINEIAAINKTTGQLYGRELELNWLNFNFASYDKHWVGLFDRDPLGENTPSAPLARYDVTTSGGHIQTEIRMEPANFTDIKGETCLDYWIGYYVQEDIRGPYRTACLRLYPSWMNDMKDVIGNKPLRKLMIPGTHDAGAWIEYDGTFASDGVIAKFTYTQEENIYNQLVSGVRYIDVRAAHYPATTGEVFWVNHGEVRIREMKNLLQDVLKFVTEFKEIVFMDFHGFEHGFSSESIHEQLYDFVVGYLEKELVPKSFTTEVTLNQLLSANKHIIWTYNDNFNQKRDLTWSTLQHAWGDKNTVPALLNYLPTAIAQYGCSRIFWSAMAELTPTSTDIITKPGYGLRNMASDVNKPLNEWYKKPEWYSKSMIVSTDYYFGSDIISTCVRVNRNNGVTC